MASLQKCLERAGELAQAVVNEWARHTVAGKASALTPAFMALFDKACLYRNAKEQVDQHRQFGLMSASAGSDPDYRLLLESAVTTETQTRQAFCKAFKEYQDS